VGFPIIIQTILNMMVATNMVPVTGQTLPLLSDGGTSIWMTFFAIGIILSVSVANNEGDKLEILTEENPLDVLYEAVD
jgi:cell division protein FtsW